MRCSALLVLVCAGVSAAFGAGASLHLLQRPAMNRTTIVFSYAGDLWSVPRHGGVASRLTVGAGMETEAAFSPDGNTIAFTGEYDGNIDVFTMPASGGVPKRITYHPDPDRAVGWTFGRQAHPVPLYPPELLPFQPALYGLNRRRSARSLAVADGHVRSLFPGWQTHGLCAGGRRPVCNGLH